MDASLDIRTQEQALLATHGELSAQAQSVMDIISNPDVVSALRQDKLHNLSYLKDNYGVRSLLFFPSPVPRPPSPRLTMHLRLPGHTRPDLVLVPLRTVPVLDRKLRRRVRLPLPLPCPRDRLEPPPLLHVG